MKTSHRSISLQSGQALAVDRHGAATLFLAEGEVLLQGPAEWLGGSVVFPPARRIAAPAVLPGGSHSIFAVGAVKIHAAVPAGSFDQLMSAWDAIRSAARMRFLRFVGS